MAMEMINGNLQAFMDSLALGMELEVLLWAG